MTASLHEMATARDLLFGTTAHEPAVATAEELRRSRALDRLVVVAPGLATPIVNEVAKATDDLLSSSLFDMVMSGWKRYDALRQAAKRTRDASGTRESVAMATHTVKAEQHPSVELYIDGKSKGIVEMTLLITFTLAGVLAVVERGRLMRIESGNCTVSGSLTVAGVEAAKRRHTFDLPGAIALRGGIPLIEITSRTE